MKHNPDEKQIEELLENFTPSTSNRLDRRLANAPWTRRAIVRRRFAGTAVFAVLMFVLFTAATPQGRAFAQRLFQFFVVAEEKSFALPTDQVFLVPATSTPAPGYVIPLATVEAQSQLEPTDPVDVSCSSPEAQAEYTCQIEVVQVRAGFDAKEFPYDPRGMEFSKVEFIPESAEICMEFVVSTGGGYLFLRQGTAAFPLRGDDWSRVPSDAIEQVSVNGNYAEVALGTWVVYPNATSAVWEPGGQLSLYWQERDRWFALEKWGDPYPIEWITKEEIVRLAESLVDDRPVDAIPPLDPENLKSVAEAERLAGYDVPEPGLLPEGYEFKRAAFTYGTVRLFYGQRGSPGNSLFIFMGPIADNQVGPCFECPPGTDEAVQVGPWQGWYWRGIFFTDAAVEGQPTPVPVWQADAPHWSLVWNTDRLWISMWFSPPVDGAEMNKETMIAIAESMK